MPDETTIKIEDLRNLGNQFDELQAPANQLIQKLGELGVAQISVAEAARELGVSQDVLATALGKVKAALAQGAAYWDLAAAKAKMLGVVEDMLAGNTAKLSDQILKGALAFEPFLNVLAKSREGFGEMGKAGDTLGAQLGESVGRIAPLLGKLGVPEAAIRGVERWGASVDMARNAERGLLAMAAATGQMTELVGEGGANIDELNAKVATFAERNFQLANALGVSVKQASTFATTVGTSIPGALDEMMGAAEGLNKVMSAQEVGMRLVQAGLIKQKELTAGLDFAFVNFGRNMAQGNVLFSKIADQVDRLGMRMDILKKFTLDAAAAFKVYGDHTMGAMSIMEAFGPALQESGLGQQAITDIVMGVTGGIQKMDVAQKAFISGVTGGPGGLAGAFDIEAMLMGGKQGLAQVGEMVMQAMQTQFGGQALTPEDVQGNQVLAAELEKQIQLLGQVAGITDRGQAMQVLRAMQSGAVEKLGQIIAEGPQDPLQKQMEMSTNLAKRQTSSLDLIANYTERMVMQGAITNYSLLRLAGRATGENTRVAMEKAADIARTVTPEGARAEVTEEQFGAQTMREAREVGDAARRAGKQVIDSIRSGGLFGLAGETTELEAAQRKGERGEELSAPERAAQEALGQVIGPAAESEAETPRRRPAVAPAGRRGPATPEEMFVPVTLEAAEAELGVGPGRRGRRGTAGAAEAGPEEMNITGDMTLKGELIIREDGTAEIAAQAAIAEDKAAQATLGIPRGKPRPRRPIDIGY